LCKRLIIGKAALSVCAMARYEQAFEGVFVGAHRVGESVATQFSAPPPMAASAKPCWRCASSKAKACLTPANCKPTGQLGKLGPGQWAVCETEAEKPAAKDLMGKLLTLPPPIFFDHDHLQPERPACCYSRKTAPESLPEPFLGLGKLTLGRYALRFLLAVV
jgi:hypothetical protein